jgi:hypothetical protein
MGKRGKLAPSKKRWWEGKWKGNARGTCVNKYSRPKLVVDMGWMWKKRHLRKPVPNPEPKLVLNGMEVEKDEAVREAKNHEVGRLSHVRWWKEREVRGANKDRTKVTPGQQMCSRTYLEQRRPVVFVLVKKRVSPWTERGEPESTGGLNGDGREKD